LGSRDVISHVTIRLLGVDFLWVVHSDHASILHCYWMHGPGHRKKDGRMKKERGRESGREGKWKVEGEKEGKEEEEKEWKVMKTL